MLQKSFKSEFPFIFRVAKDKKPKIVDYLSTNGGGVRWSPCLMRDLNDWEINPIENLLRVLKNAQLRMSNEDIRKWIQASSENFSVKSCYE